MFKALTFVVILSALVPSADASAQGVVGGAFMVSRLPRADYTPGTLAVPPNGLVRGAVLFGGAVPTPRIALLGELSIPAELVTFVTSKHPSLLITDSTQHRDTILSGLVRLRAASWCDVFIGGGLDVERTRVTTTFSSYYPGAPLSESFVDRAATRAVITTGVDFPIRLTPKWALLPTGRVHVIRRHTPDVNVRDMSAASIYSFRLGIGLRAEF